MPLPPEMIKTRSVMNSAGSAWATGSSLTGVDSIEDVSGEKARTVGGDDYDYGLLRYE